MRFRSAFMYKRQDNIKVAHSLIQSRRFTDHDHYNTSTIMSISTIMANVRQFAPDIWSPIFRLGSAGKRTKNNLFGCGLKNEE